MGPYKICGSCYQRLNTNGYIDPDSSRHGAEFVRLYPDGNVKRMKHVLRKGTLEFIQIPLDQTVPENARLYRDSEEE